MLDHNDLMYHTEVKLIFFSAGIYYVMFELKNECSWFAQTALISWHIEVGINQISEQKHPRVKEQEPAHGIHVVVIK